MRKTFARKPMKKCLCDNAPFVVMRKTHDDADYNVMLNSDFEVGHWFPGTLYQDQHVFTSPLGYRDNDDFVQIDTQEVFHVLRCKISQHVTIVAVQSLILDYMTPKSVFIDTDPILAQNETHG